MEVGSGLGANGTDGNVSNEAQVPGGPDGANLGGGTSADDARKAEAKALKEILEEAFKAKNREASLYLKEKAGSKVSERIRQERLKARSEKQGEVISEQGSMARKALLEVNFEELKKKSTEHSDLLESAKEQAKDRSKDARERRDLGGR